VACEQGAGRHAHARTQSTAAPSSSRSSGCTWPASSGR
jgi:hypothetical protein